MNVFDLRERLVSDYANYISSFIEIQDKRIRDYVDESLKAGLLWPDPMIQLNPSFEPGKSIDESVQEIEDCPENVEYEFACFKKKVE